MFNGPRLGPVSLNPRGYLTAKDNVLLFIFIGKIFKMLCINITEYLETFYFIITKYFIYLFIYVETFHFYIFVCAI